VSTATSTRGVSSGTSISGVSRPVRRWTIDIQSTPQDFRERYEQAVPPLPGAEVQTLALRHAPWQAMLDLMAKAAPWGSVIYNVIDADQIMRLAGDRAYCVSYLMGNHTIAERMFRHEPAILLYPPLRTAIWGDAEGPAHFTFDQPSDQFSSFGNPEITAVGIELDHKMAALLDHLGAAVPDALVTT
jgi:uncharacterized protein (DUF302 family)